ncbi:helix-turn-helix domain-containing protein [Parahaliea mediterranea]|uniref:AraC family transcriptional regulator n=1 Tax=Parahaliea mediterranea TaxID=651086 RepID=A0A939DCH2_9GAMM|nr:helix-turn-helix domain-containing protein [Parahaliea mediterranea]MBN7795535.1 AraC family transcriptional regulator [Parahaliea mediterranea]
MTFLREALLVASAQGALLCAVLLSVPSGNRRANNLLVLYIGLESLHLFYLYLVQLAEFSAPSYTLRMVFGLRYLDGPVLFLYVKALTDPDFRLRPRELAHTSVLLVWLAWFAYMASSPGWLRLNTQALQVLPSTVLASAMQSLIVMVYALLSLRQVERHRHRVKQALSAVDSLGLGWLRWLLLCMVLVSLLHIACDGFRWLGWMSSDVKAVINLSVTALLVYFIAIGGLRQPQIFSDHVRAALDGVHSGHVAAPAEVDTDSGKYQKSGMDIERRTELWKQLQGLLAADKPYLEPTLDLPKLAKMLAIRPQELSETINQEYGGSFYDLINFHRVEAAKTLLADPASKQRKLLDIALSVGFVSQSTFYNRFKRVTGLTPAKYRELGGLAGTANSKPHTTELASGS